MRTVTLERGDGTIDVELPDSTVVVRPVPADEPPPLIDPLDSTRDAIRNPRGMEPIPDLVRSGSTVTIAFPDRVKGGSHPTAHRRLVLNVLLDELHSAGVRSADINLVCAIGLHRKNRLSEIAGYLGRDIVERVGAHNIHNHDAEDPVGIVALPASEMGDVVEVNARVVNSDLTILIGHTSGNPYGGFSGGYKMPATGLTTWRSIRCHHAPHSMYRSDFAHATTDSHFRRQLAAIGRRMEAEMPRPFLAVDAVLNSRSEQLEVVAGAIPEVERGTWSIAARRTDVEVPGPPADVLVLGMPRNFHYGNGMGSNPILMMQAVGASLARAKRALRNHPVIIAASTCDGWFNEAEFPAYPAAFEAFQSVNRAEDMAALEEEFATHPEWIYQYRFRYGYHPFHAFSMLYMGGLAVRTAAAVYIAGARKPGLARAMGARSAPSVEAALEDAKRLVGPDPRVLVVPALSQPGYHLRASEAAVDD